MGSEEEINGVVVPGAASAVRHCVTSTLPPPSHCLLSSFHIRQATAHLFLLDCNKKIYKQTDGKSRIISWFRWKFSRKLYKNSKIPFYLVTRNHNSNQSLNKQMEIITISSSICNRNNDRTSNQTDGESQSIRLFSIATTMKLQINRMRIAPHSVRLFAITTTMKLQTNRTINHNRFVSSVACTKKLVTRNCNNNQTSNKHKGNRYRFVSPLARDSIKESQRNNLNPCKNTHSRWQQSKSNLASRSNGFGFPSTLRLRQRIPKKPIKSSVKIFGDRNFPLIWVPAVESAPWVIARNRNAF